MELRSKTASIHLATDEAATVRSLFGIASAEDYAVAEATAEAGVSISCFRSVGIDG